MGLFDGTQIDNSRFTPEYNQGQANQTTTVPNTTPTDGQVDEGAQPTVPSDAGIQTEQNNGTQAPVDGQASEPIVIGDKSFDSVDDLIAAYNSLNTSYDNIRKDYTKKAQELSLRKKQDMSANRMTYPNVPFQQPNQVNPFNQQVAQNNPYMQYNNPYYTNASQPNSMEQIAQRQQQMMSQVNQQVAMNQAMIQMAADNAINELRTTDASFNEVAPELWDVIDTDPYFSTVQFDSPEMVKNTVQMAYTIAKQRIEQAKANIQINNAKKEAYKSKQNKITNNDASNGVAKRQTPPATPEDNIKKGIIDVKPVRF